jgi:hypothetical protein
MITNNFETDGNGMPRFAGLDEQNECQRIGRVSCDSDIRIISTHDFVRLWRVCRAFVLPLQGDGRAGGPLTQGGARRLRRLALPWANLFCPFGAGRFLELGPFLQGWAVRSAPGPRDSLSMRIMKARRAVFAVGLFGDIQRVSRAVRMRWNQQSAVGFWLSPTTNH